MVEVISLHIPKTAGKSFYKVLSKMYGNKLDTRIQRKDYFPETINISALANNIPEHITVMHGHLLYKHVKPIREKYNSKIITWLRDPVDRVISNYYFLMQTIRKKQRKIHQHHDKMDYTLMDYASMKSVQNRMTKYLSGIELEDLFFIGFLEYFDEDLKTLGKLLNWQVNIPNVFENNGSSYRKNPTCATKTVTDEMKERIRELNSLDVDLYQEAIGLRRKNLNRSIKKIQ